MSQLGEFYESKVSKDAPLIFIVGGKDTKNGIPGKYMMDLGFKNLKDFNIYNVRRTEDGNEMAAYAECLTIMKQKGITPSKEILLGYSLGAARLPALNNKRNWDMVISSGAYIAKYEKTYNDHKELINKLTPKDAKNNPISSKFVYVHSNAKNKTNNGDGQLLKIVNELEKMLPEANSVEHTGDHANTVTATANWIKNNVIVNKDGSSSIKIPSPSSNSRRPITRKNNDIPFGLGPHNQQIGANKDVKQIQNQSDLSSMVGQLNTFFPKINTKTGESKGPTTGQSDKCLTDNKRDAVLKGNKTPKKTGNSHTNNADGTSKDSPPPPKNQKPQWSSNKYNHRFYILPISKKSVPSTDGIKSNSKKPTSLHPWHGEYFDPNKIVEESSDGDIKTYKVKLKNKKKIYIKTTVANASTINYKKTIMYVNSNLSVSKEQISSIEEVPENLIPKDVQLKKDFAGTFSPNLPSEKPRNNSEKKLESYPAKLVDMVKPNSVWYNRYWAYRINSGPNFGFQKYESTISANGISLISGVIPYWEPPFDDTNPIEEPLVKGDWVKLIKNQTPINSPIDVPIMLNAYQVGVMNDNIGYIYESENELHMTLLESEIINKGKLAIGQALNETNANNKVPDSAWSLHPRWSGIFAEHCLKNSGFTLQEKLGTNIDFYHRSIIQRGRLVNHPGNALMPWSEMKELGVKHRMFKPSKIWLDSKYLNQDEYLENDADSAIAIFVVGYHINHNGTLTERGKRLVNHINNVLKWPMATISAVPHHQSNSTLCYTDVLLYMDDTGTVVTIGGNTEVPGGDATLKSGNHIALKVTNFARFAKVTTTTFVNGSVIVARVKTGPKPEFFRESSGMANRLYTTPLFMKYEDEVTKISAPKIPLKNPKTGKDRTKAIDMEGKINSDYYNKLRPYIVTNNICQNLGTMTKGPQTIDDIGLNGDTTEPEYLPPDFEPKEEMEKVSTEKCKDLKAKYNFTKSKMCIKGISATALNKPLDNKGCVGGLTPVHIAHLAATLAALESQNTYNITNPYGYRGRFQFGTDALRDINFLSNNVIDNPSSWSAANSKKYGVTSLNYFLNCPIVQEIAIQLWIEKLWKQLQTTETVNVKDKKTGKTVKVTLKSIPLGTLPCDKIGGLILAAHLLGSGSIRQWYHGGKDKKDGNGVLGSTYFKMGVNAINGIFTTDGFSSNQMLKGIQHVCKGDKYFLYPGPLSNGLGSIQGKTPEVKKKPTPAIIQSNPNTAPKPNNDTVEREKGTFFVKFSPSSARIVTIPQYGPADQIGLTLHLPEEFIDASGAKNGIVCSWTEGPIGSSKNKFGKMFIPPLKTEHIDFTEFNGSPAYKLTPEEFDCPYLCYIDTNNNFHMTRTRGVAVPANAKYAWSTKWLGSYKLPNSRMIMIDAKTKGDERPRSMIGRLEDGNMFVWSTSRPMTLYAAAQMVSKIPGVEETLHLDGGNSAQLYYNGKFLHRANKTRKFPNYLIWD